MSFLENGIFCSAEEYKKDIPKRVMESDVRDGDDIYTLAMRLQSQEKEAAKLAVRMLSVERNAGLVAVKFSFLDMDLNPSKKEPDAAIVANGYMQRLTTTVVREAASGQGYAVTQAYLKDYFDDQFGGLLAESSELLLTH